MSKFISVNVRVPPSIRKMWAENFNPKGSRTSSRHASGAMFLYWIMPGFVRTFADEVAQIQDMDKARDLFWDKIRRTQADAERVETLLGPSADADRIVRQAEADALAQPKTSRRTRSKRVG